MILPFVEGQFLEVNIPLCTPQNSTISLPSKFCLKLVPGKQWGAKGRASTSRNGLSGAVLFRL